MGVLLAFIHVHDWCLRKPGKGTRPSEIGVATFHVDAEK